MKKELLNFNRKLKLLFESKKITEDAEDTGDITVNTTATVNGEEIPVTTNEEISVNEIEVLKDKLKNLLELSCKNAYASNLYAKNVGNIDAIRDAGFYAGQKQVLKMVLRDLEDIQKPKPIPLLENKK